MTDTRPTPTALLQTLSDDAKAVLGGHFGALGMPDETTLEMTMRKSRPTERMARALEELTSAGALARRDLPEGGIEYTLKIEPAVFGKWLRRNKSVGRWRTMEPVEQGVLAP